MKPKAIIQKQLLEKLKNLQKQIKDLKDSELQYEKQEESLRESEEKYRTLVENLNVGVFRNTGGPQGKYLHANRALIRMFGYGRVHEFMKVPVSEFYQNPKERRLFVKEIFKKGFVKNKELRLRKKDGTPMVASCTAKIHYDKKGEIKWMDGIIEDITERKKTEEALNKQRYHLAKAQEISHVGTWDLDVKANKLIWTDEAYRIFGIPIGKELSYEIFLKSVHPDDKGYVDKKWKAALNKEPYDIEHRIIVKNKIKWVREKAKLEFDKQNKVIRGIGAVQDITERKNTEKELERAHKELLESNRKLQRQSFHDSHTGLFNYRYLQEIIEVEFQRAKRHAQSLSVLMIDLDYFKSINDVYGHQFGDLILKQFARQLKKLVRKYDIVARFGGEEFVIILPSSDKIIALKSARRIIDAMGICNFGNKQCSIKLKLSIGVASYPENLVLKGTNLINSADKNLNIAKEKGGNRIWFSLAEQTKSRPASGKKITTEEDVHDLKKKINQLTKRSNQSLAEAIFAFARTIKLKDSYTGRHVEQTVYYATEIARALDLASQELECIKQAAILHDLGKIGISERILNKKGKLSQKEKHEIKRHPVIAGDILRPIQFLHDIIPLILYHHERWDGKGYPSGLKGEEIPLGARIVALADVFQALISNRSYRQAFSLEEAAKIIKKEAGTKFDPKVVKLFLNILQQK